MTPPLSDFPLSGSQIHGGGCWRGDSGGGERWWRRSGLGRTVQGGDVD
jgi:hypothetical protein